METSINQNTNETQSYDLEFHGSGLEYFKIIIVNWLLTVISLGFYYPWARAKRLRYIYGQTALNNERFHFSGTGKEMFIGFIRLILLNIAIFGLFFLLAMVQPFLAVLFFYLAILAVIPFAIHGSFRYRMSRTTYRGIRFGYRGSRKELVINFFKWIILTIITFGIYGFWLQMNIRRYTHGNLRYGDVEFVNDSSGGEWFMLNLKGYILTVLTLGIYSFRWICNRFDYYINNIRIQKGEQVIYCYSVASGLKFFSLIVTNVLIIVLTLGFGKAWADMRTQIFICENIKMEGDINIDDIHQTEEEYTNAFGEDAMDYFEIDLA